jgi:asparagine synthase (glutamine-hydrolysing)
MCGISGVISNSSFHIDTIINMNNVIRHRGPNDEGFVFFREGDFAVAGGNDTAIETWEADLNYCPKRHYNALSEDNYSIGFGHRRLSILDLSPYGHQPMCILNQRYWITYNGEVYNYIEIRNELKDLGYAFTTNSDTEVILAAYDKWGIECLNKFNGMWAMAIYDTIEKTIFLSRDRYGIKPLYYWVSPIGNFYFASEIKQFTVLPEWEAIGNKQRILDYLFYSTTDHTDETLFKGVYQIKPGHFIKFSLAGALSNKLKNVNQEQWYLPERKLFKGTFQEASKLFRKYFEDAVFSHLRADVPVGSALSGGLDSSSVVCLINDEFKKSSKATTQKTFSSVSSNVKYSEKKWMDAVIDDTNVDPYFIYPSADDVFNQIENITWHMDEPFQSLSPFLSYNIFAKARKEGVVVLLNGQGADEYLSGYGEFEKLYIKSQFNILKLVKFFKFIKQKNLRNVLTNLSFFFPYGLIKFFQSKNRTNKKIANLFKKGFTSKQYVHPYHELNYNKANNFEVSNFQLFHDPLQRYLHWEDRNSMAHSVESRVPFLDYRLVEFARQLPLEYHLDINIPKKILVNSLSDILPEKIKNRRDKIGYISPEEIWVKSESKSKFLDLLNQNKDYIDSIFDFEKVLAYFEKIQNGEIPFSYDYWRIIHFGLWVKIFNIRKIE